MNNHLFKKYLARPLSVHLKKHGGWEGGGHRLAKYYTCMYVFPPSQWSFGVVCWEIFSLGAKPFRGIENPDIPERISNGERLQKPSLSSGEM